MDSPLNQGDRKLSSNPIRLLVVESDPDRVPIMLDYLAQRAWIQEAPLLLTSKRSAGQRLPFRQQTLECHDVAIADFAGIKIALFSAGSTACQISISSRQRPMERSDRIHLVLLTWKRYMSNLNREK